MPRDRASEDDIALARLAPWAATATKNTAARPSTDDDGGGVDADLLRGSTASEPAARAAAEAEPAYFSRATSWLWCCRQRTRGPKARSRMMIATTITTIVVLAVLIVLTTLLAVHFTRSRSQEADHSTTNAGRRNVSDLVAQDVADVVAACAATPAVAGLAFTGTNIGMYVPAPHGNGSGVTAIHVGLMKGTSKVVMLERWDFGGSGATLADGVTPAWSTEYDYTTDTYRVLRLRSNVFCGGGMLLPDARMTVFGGAEEHEGLGGILNGEMAIRYLSPTGSAGRFGNADWIDEPGDVRKRLLSKRWYPTVVMLPEGRVLLIGGSSQGVEFNFANTSMATYEIVPDPGMGLKPLQFLWDTTPSNLYGVANVLPNGLVYMFASDRSMIMDPTRQYAALRTEMVKVGAGGCLRALDDATGLAVAPCVDKTKFDQNRTAVSSQTFVFFPVEEVAYMRASGFGFMYNTAAGKCVTGGAAKTAATLQRCDLGRVDQMFTTTTDGRIMQSKRCLSTAGKNSTAIMTDCTSGYDAMQAFNRIDASIYFEFPRLPPYYPRSYPWTGTGLMLPLDPATNYTATVMVCGGSWNADASQDGVSSNRALGISTCGLLTPTNPSADWTMEDMPTPRVLGDLVHLPDGSILLLNGAKRGMAGWDLGREPNLAAHLYIPTNAIGHRWTVLNATSVPRMYHSVAQLLPDGRVLVAGSAPNSPTEDIPGHAFKNELRVEYYMPHYLVGGGGGRRPSIVGFLERWDYNRSTVVSIDADPAALTRFSLVQTGFRTHSTGMGQRFVWLASDVLRGSEAGDGMFAVATPPRAAIAPPGWYLLFAVVQGVPSEGVWVQVGGDPANIASWNI